MLDAPAVVIANAVSLAGLGFFVKMWINGVNTQLKEMREEMKVKVDDKMCCERRKFITEEYRADSRRINQDTDDIFKRLRQVEAGK